VVTPEEHRQKLLSDLSCIMSDLMEGKIDSLALTAVYASGQVITTWSTQCCLERSGNSFMLLGAVSHIQSRLQHEILRYDGPVHMEDFDGRTQH
jgi:hypothetical protein